MFSPAETESLPVGHGYVDRIPVRNIWLLMLYASDLFRHRNFKKVALEENPDDIPDLVAELLADIVDNRLKRNLSYGYRWREATLSRVRGRIDLLKTERHRLFDQGMVACLFEEFTIDTPRNRYVRAALASLARIVDKKELSARCNRLDGILYKLGVTGEKPPPNEASINRFGRHDASDQFMVTVAHLAFDLALPTEFTGSKGLTSPEREKRWIHKLYEKAVAGFYSVVLKHEGWRVCAGKRLNWLIEDKTEGIDAILPSMTTDILLEHQSEGKRIVIDTKFNAVVTKGHYRKETIRNNYLYQIYAYLRSQEGVDPLAKTSSGLLLHPSVGTMMNETVVIQRHPIRFATVDLGASAPKIRDQLRRVVDFCTNDRLERPSP